MMGIVVLSLGSGPGGLVMVISLLRMKTRFADKSTAEHYYYYCIETVQSSDVTSAICVFAS